MGDTPKFSTDFIKKINRKKYSKKLKRMIIIPVIVFIAVLFCTGQYGFLKIFRLHKKIVSAEKEIDRLKVQAVDYQWEISKLKNDSVYIKLYASEIYGYGKAGQTIIQFIPPIADTTR